MVIREKYRFYENDIVLFFMGYLYDFSGLLTIADYLQDQVTKYPHIKLFIVGEGPIYDKLCTIQKEIPNNLVILSWRPYNEIPALLSASDICILPAELNNTMKYIVPIKILEYMAAGKPVISTELPGIKKEFNDNSGIIYIKNAMEVFQMATDLVKNNLIDSYSLCALESLKFRDWNSLSNRFEAALTEMLVNYPKVKT
jgi:glycosyltransferase involved in cell wall biosynthesis